MTPHPGLFWKRYPQFTTREGRENCRQEAVRGPCQKEGLKALSSGTVTVVTSEVFHCIFLTGKDIKAFSIFGKHVI